MGAARGAQRTTAGGRRTVSADASPLRGAPVHVPALDGVRGLAVLIVIIHNAGWIAGSSEQFVMKLFTAITSMGWIGVQLFFALSGFLITGILLDSVGRPHYFKSFFLRRTLRIFPLYYAFVAATVFIAAPLAWDAAWAADVRASQWPYWLYISNWTQPLGVQIHGLTHLWSLAVEEQFYLVWPLVVWGLGRRGLIRLATAMLLAGPVIRFVLRAAELPEATAYMFTIARWDALAAGALLAALLREDRGRALVARWTRPATLGALGALVVFLFVERGFHSGSVMVQVIGQSLINVLAACLIAFAVGEEPRAARALQRGLSWEHLRTLGKYSYAMYVFHFPIHHGLKPFLGPWVEGPTDDSLRLVRVAAYLALILILTFGASLLSWRLIEKPFLDLKEKWAPRVG